MKFTLVEDMDSGLKNESAMGVLDEDVLNEASKVNLGPLRQFLKSIIATIPKKKFKDYDIHHLDGNNKDSSVGNIVLIPHYIHSSLTNTSSVEHKKSLLLHHAKKLSASIELQILTMDDVNQIYNEVERG